MDSDEEWSRDGFTKKSIFSAKNKCQFCSAFSIDELSSAVHSEKCVARLSAFMASDGQIKFACMVSAVHFYQSDSRFQCFIEMDSNCCRYAVTYLME